jgi:hypothetical protein
MFSRYRKQEDATEDILDEASENTQTSTKMPFQRMTSHCMACQLAQQLCFLECIFHLDQTAEVENCIIKMGMQDMYWSKIWKLALTKVRQGVTLTSPWRTYSYNNKSVGCRLWSNMGT